MRPQLGPLGDGALERLGRLHWQAGDQVGIDGLETQGLGLAHQRLHTFERLHAVHGGLHRRVEVLDSEADAVEAQSRQVLQTLRVGGARVDLDGDLGTWRQHEGAAQHVHQVGQLVVGKELGRPTPQLQLRHRLPAPQLGGVQVDLRGQRLQVGATPFVMLGDDLVACAVVAH